MLVGQVVLPPAGGDVVYVLLGLGVAAALLLGLRWQRPARSGPWRLMVAGQLTWVVGDAVYFWRKDVVGTEPFPSLSDGLYLVGYAVLVLGLLLLVRARRSGSDPAGRIDALIVTAGLALLTCVVLVEPVVAGAGGLSTAAAAVSVAYPLVDILLIAGLVRLLAAPGTSSPALRLLLVALGLLVSADLLSAAADVYGLHVLTSSFLLWQASYVVWAAAALHPSMHQVTEPEPVPVVTTTRPLRRMRVAWMAGATLVTPLILAVEELSGGQRSTWTVVVGSVVMVLLVVFRMNLAIHHIVEVSRQRNDLQEELGFRATHDSLTGLPNRAETMRLVTEALRRSAETAEPVGLLFVDLDGFKAVNDTLGHRAGDEVLRAVATRLGTSTRAGDIATRLGGDEFVVLLGHAVSEDSALAIADRLVDELSRSIRIDERNSVRIGASIGIALSHPDSDADTLLNEADLALYRAKADGRGRHVMFGPSLRGEIGARVELEAALDQALAHDELRVHYQPILDVATGELRGYEALLRWERPGHGLLLPGAFLPVAESSELVCDLNAWVLEAATAQLAAFGRSSGRTDLVVAVNVSGRHVRNRRIRSDVGGALDRSGLHPAQLVLEVTGTGLAEHPTAAQHLAALRELGVRVSLDDFGSGYSSLGQLAALPVDIVKIAAECLDTSSVATRALLELMVKAAHTAGMLVAGEGVETFAQLAVLRELGCEWAQGYLLGSPMSPSEADEPTVTAEPSSPRPSTG